MLLHINEIEVYHMYICLHLHDKDKNCLLRQWVSSGMNLQACESRSRVSKEQGLRGEKVWAQVPVRDMGIPPLNFSEFLGASIINHHHHGWVCEGIKHVLSWCFEADLRAKVQHIIATQVGERDEQAPDSLEDTLYWVVLKRTQTESTDYKCLGCSFCLFDVVCVCCDSMYTRVSIPGSISLCPRTASPALLSLMRLFLDPILACSRRKLRQPSRHR